MIKRKSDCINTKQAKNITLGKSYLVLILLAVIIASCSIDTNAPLPAGAQAPLFPGKNIQQSTTPVIDPTKVLQERQPTASTGTSTFFDSNGQLKNILTQDDINKIIAAEKNAAMRKEKSDELYYKFDDEVLGLREKKPNNCADERLKSAQTFQQRAKNYLKDYYLNRTNKSIYYSWYALQDSNHAVEAIVSCDDKKNRHFYSKENILTQNMKIKQVIAANGRSKDYFEFGELFLDDYYTIFPRDLK